MTTPTPPAKRGASPVGRDEVVAATLAGAAELFAERGPAGTSIRDIATRANVNHGLVYRHFGTKERLVGAVLEHLGARLTALLGDGAEADDIERTLDQHTRVMARALLDGYPVGQLQTRFPGVARLLDEVVPKFDDERRARMAVANAVALQLGWRLFEPFLRSAAGIEEVSRADVQHSVGAEIARILEPDR
ncbi:TetR/AcrR family transcriptional regulator [Mycolicibacterium wolinskyi]|uniref:TetR family transcriptional regulator n=1 Tax=Mycolicibacterium wolinskyi TaxID=59750 RepID=A0A1X2EZX2_9MYCO|nr:MULTISPECIES: TetR/AcrR family transcriptional regulator [Mycolicibacterium]MCV7288511.1 TetR/AcrR family transcriptional regulator [Mycolicibacterium wolinskyi]MCV7295733.1 TetR/AcrR family transcriptional regulator [Mycolicibacterium goodii]ORX11743.1 TetR family transcriptional regulator [Mycolicibacterium wolinskyi]